MNENNQRKHNFELYITKSILNFIIINYNFDDSLNFQIHKLLVEWLDDIDHKIQSDDSLLNDLSEKKAKLEKFKTFNRDIDSHSDLVKKLNEKLQEDTSLKSKEIEDTFKRYDDIRKTVNEMIAVSNYCSYVVKVFIFLDRFFLAH